MLSAVLFSSLPTDREPELQKGSYPLTRTGIWVVSVGSWARWTPLSIHGFHVSGCVGGRSWGAGLISIVIVHEGS